MISPLTWPDSPFRGTIAPDEVHLWAWALQPAPLDLPTTEEVLYSATIEKEPQTPAAEAIEEPFEIEQIGLKRKMKREKNVFFYLI